MNVRAFTGSTEVISSGTIVPFASEGIRFELSVGTKVTVKIKFADDKDAPKFAIESTVVSPHELDITLKNYNEVLGAGLLHPVKIGTFEKRDLFFAFRVYHLPPGEKTFHYTFYWEVK